VQTYTRRRFGPHGMLGPEPGVPLTTMGYEFWPEALGVTIRRAAEVTGAPVLVTENGVATEDDAERVEFVRRALHSVLDCLADGVDVRGYTYWRPGGCSTTSSGRSATGPGSAWSPSTGRTIQARTPKPSATWLARSPSPTGSPSIVASLLRIPVLQIRDRLHAKAKQPQNATVGDELVFQFETFLLFLSAAFDAAARVAHFV
jgi:beta-glucosidase